MKASYSAAAWFLSLEYWGLSVELQPLLPQEERRKLVAQLVAPVLDKEVEGIVKAGLIVRLFQVLLLASLGLDRQGPVP